MEVKTKKRKIKWLIVVFDDGEFEYYPANKIDQFWRDR